MENYTKFTIDNFRCFSSEQTLVLAVPDQGKIGSGITYIVGPNNSGKTTLIESLNFRVGSSINSSDKRKEGELEFKYYNDDALVADLRLAETSNKLIDYCPQKSDLHVEVITSRRHWQPAITGHAHLHRTVKQLDNISSALQGIANDGHKYAEFTEYVKQIFPEFNKWKVGHENNQSHIEYISQDGVSHKSDLLGDGIIAVIRILIQFFNKESSVLIIDEPELSLHPLAQKKLIKLIAEHAQNRQIIIVTHSPYFISWEYIQNGAILNRVAKENEANSRIYTLGKYGDYEKLINGANWQQPFLMDIVSKEIFFQDNILFLEGQEDVGLLQRYFADKEINLFGYGVRGYNRFELAFKLAKDLGIKKACILIDSPGLQSTEPNENTIKQRLENEYESTKYKVVQWNKADIRDKESYNFSAKEGYYTKDGELKPEEELDDFHQKIDSISTYFLEKTEKTK